MTLYHGSQVEVCAPALEYSRPNVDFGRGFYTTPLYEQAESWCMRFIKAGKKGVISRYQFDDSTFTQLSCLCFETYSEAWLDFVLTCRRGEDKTTYDIVSGGVANDRVFNTLQLYSEGLIEKYEALKRLRYEKPNLQICFRTTLALKYLFFKGSEQL